MLSKLKYGWTELKLDGTSQYSLSYIMVNQNLYM